MGEKLCLSEVESSFFPLKTLQKQYLDEISSLTDYYTLLLAAFYRNLDLGT